MEKIDRIIKDLGLKSKSISTYGNKDGVNIRISDHLPKYRNLQDYLPTLVEDENGEVKYLFIVISDEEIDIDTDEWEDEMTEWLEDMTGVECSVSLGLFSKEDYKTISIYTEMLINTI